MTAFVYETPIRFADVDHAGIVYYPRFFDLFHVAFEELWRTRRGPRAYAEILDRDRIGFPAVHAECDFSAPLRFGDAVAIHVTVAKLSARSIVFRYRIYRADVPAPEVGTEGGGERVRTLAAEGRVTCAVVDLARFVAVPVPDHVVEMLQDLVDS